LFQIVASFLYLPCTR